MAEAPDWRSHETERELSRLERQEFAWEFLRRNPDYRRDYTRERSARRSAAASDIERSSAPRWGLRFPARSGPLRP